MAAAGPRLPFAWQAQYTELLEELRRGGRWPAAAFCLAGAVHRASALPFCVAGVVYRALSKSCGAVAAAGPRLPGRRSTQSLRTSLLRGRRTTCFVEELRRGGRRWPAAAWQAQYTEPPHFPCAWQAQYIELSRGAAARWPPLARGCLAGAVHRAFALSFCVARAVHRAFLRSCGAVAAAGPRLPFAWQAQYTEPPRFPCAWQAQYTELSRGAAALPFAWQA